MDGNTKTENAGALCVYKAQSVTVQPGSVRPLDAGAETVAVLRVVNQLQHISRQDAGMVLADWARVLKPGGVLRVAVPDFTLAKTLAAEDAQDVLDGGRLSEQHCRSLWDEAKLRAALGAAGLTDVQPWEPDDKETAATHLLRLQGTKPITLSLEPQESPAYRSIREQLSGQVPVAPARAAEPQPAECAETPLPTSKANWQAHPGPGYFAWMQAHVRDDYTRNGEDGVLEAILSRLPEGPKTFAESYADPGRETSCARALERRGWKQAPADNPVADVLIATAPCGNYAWECFGVYGNPRVLVLGTTLEGTQAHIEAAGRQGYLAVALTKETIFFVRRELVPYLSENGLPLARSFIAGRLHAVMSLPRLGFVENFICHMDALPPLGISLRAHTGVFWGQCLTRGLEAHVNTSEFLMTLDYDTVYARADVEELFRLMITHPEVDAIAPVQCGRESQAVLFGMKDEQGKNRDSVLVTEFGDNLVRVNTAHFGLTLIRSEALKRVPTPWFWSQPDGAGRWEAGHVDDDIWFWRQWEKAGNTLFVAPKVVVGHLQQVNTLPDERLRPLHVMVSEYRAHGMPPTVWKGVPVDEAVAAPKLMPAAGQRARSVEVSNPRLNAVGLCLDERAH